MAIMPAIVGGPATTMATAAAMGCLLLLLLCTPAPSLAAHGPALAFVGHQPHRGAPWRSCPSRAHHAARPPTLLHASEDDGGGTSPNSNDELAPSSKGVRSLVRRGVTKATRRVQKASERMSQLVSPTLTSGPIATASPIAGVLTDAALTTAELAAAEVRSAAHEMLSRRNGGTAASKVEERALAEADAAAAMDAIMLAQTSVADAFDAAERSLAMAEAEVQRARRELEAAKRDAGLGLAAARRMAAEAAQRAEWDTERAVREAMGGMPSVVEEDLAGEVLGEEGDEGAAVSVEDSEPPIAAAAEESAAADTTAMPLEAKVHETMDEEEVAVEEKNEPPPDKFDVSSLGYDDVDFGTVADMAPPFLGEDECLVPGEPVVRVEKAPQNSRRIFAGIDIPVSVDDVWKLLTDYENLQRVVPNLVVNEVLQLYDGNEGSNDALQEVDASLSDAEQCRILANGMKGAVLRQVGGAKVVGINFSARTTLEVREWPAGMPDFAHYEDEVYMGKSRSDRAREGRGRELARYAFPRPFALSSLPHKDISMQSVEDDDGEFRMYQGVWRMQPLPGCSPPGGSAMRLTYAVEVSPRPYLPVALVEGRIARDLCSNLEAIRDVFAAREQGR